MSSVAERKATSRSDDGLKGMLRGSGFRPLSGKGAGGDKRAWAIVAGRRHGVRCPAPNLQKTAGNQAAWDGRRVMTKVSTRVLRVAAAAALAALLAAPAAHAQS